MQDTDKFVRKQRNRLALKYMRRSLKTVVRRPIKITPQELADIDAAYTQFIETPTR